MSVQGLNIWRDCKEDQSQCRDCEFMCIASSSGMLPHAQTRMSTVGWRSWNKR